MLLGTRFTNIRGYRRPFSAISSCHALRFTSEFSSSSQPKVNQITEALPLHLSGHREKIEAMELYSSTEEPDDAFLPWLERKAETKISSVLSIGKSSIGRFLFASETIRAGNCILNVPFSVQISPDNLPSAIRILLGEEIGNVAKLAVAVLLEQKFDLDSEWAPYINRLPQPWDMHNTIFWSESELEMIHNSSLYEESLNRRSQIEKEFLAIRQALETFPEIFDSINYEDFMHAYALVTSRAWGSTKGFSLIPFADFLNHDGTSEAVVLNDDEKQFSEVIADRDYAPGEQVLIRYGKYPNATLMLDFGFTLPYNIHDQVQVQVKTVEDDPLARIKLELWQRSCAPTSKYVNSIYFPMNSFTIREVRSATGKGRGLPQSLRAFGRILSCTHPRELSDLSTEATSGDGRLARIPLKNVNREVEAHRILLSQFKQLIEEYNASIESLGPVDSPCLCKKFAQRRLMAQHLLIGELRILNSATAWLENYCDTLTTKVSAI